MLFEGLLETFQKTVQIRVERTVQAKGINSSPKLTEYSEEAVALRQIS